jgi:hypothetical protein
MQVYELANILTNAMMDGTVMKLTFLVLYMNCILCVYAICVGCHQELNVEIWMRKNFIREYVK